MSKKQLSILFLILTIVIAFLFLNRKSNTAFNVAGLETKSQTKTNHEKESEPVQILPTANVKQKNNSTLLKQVVNDCLKKNWEFSNLTQLEEQILLTESITEETTELENIHFSGKNKENLRAQIIYTGKHKELRLFKVLKDGLPDFIELPASDRINPDSTTLAKYINYESIQWRQIQKKLITAQGNSLWIETTNSQVDRLDYYLNTGVNLHCQATECQCK